MSLTKVACVLITTICLHISFTPPNPPPPKREQRAPTLQERYLKLIFTTLVLTKVTFWALAFAEIGTVIINSLPPPIFQRAQQLRILQQFRADPDILSIAPLGALGMALSIFGGVVRFQCYRALSKFFTFEMSIREDHKLVTSGPYNFVRHPSYTGMVAAVVGMACWYGSKGSWLRESRILDNFAGRTFVFTYATVMIGVLSSLLGRMSTEDEALRKAFNKEWDEWAKRVPYSVIPGLY